MGNAKLNPWVQYVVVIGMLILIAGSFTWMTPKEIIIPTIAVPSAAEIASLIVIPETVIPETVIPEAKELDNKKISDIWKIMFNDCYVDLEDGARETVIDEIDEDDLIEFIEDSLENFDKLKKVRNLQLDDDETEVVINEIGYCVIGGINGTEFGDDENDKSAEVTLVYTFKYQDTFDTTWYKDSVTVTGTIEYDEGDFEDYDVELIYTI